MSALLSSAASCRPHRTVRTRSVDMRTQKLAWQSTQRSGSWCCASVLCACGCTVGAHAKAGEEAAAYCMPTADLTHQAHSRVASSTQATCELAANLHTPASWQGASSQSLHGQYTQAWSVPGEQSSMLCSLLRQLVCAVFLCRCQLFAVHTVWCSTTPARVPVKS